MQSLLKCIGVSKKFGGLQALKNVDFAVGDGEIVGLVGPNGSGKSTLLNLVSGVYKPDTGQILFNDEDISNLPPYKICAKGITKTAQTVQSFPEMTATQNVLTSVLFNEKKAVVKVDTRIGIIGGEYEADTAEIVGPLGVGGLHFRE